MKRYLAKPKRPRAIDEYDYENYYEPDISHDTPVVDETSGPQFTGLYDSKGNPLYRMPEKVGF